MGFQKLQSENPEQNEAHSTLHTQQNHLTSILALFDKKKVMIQTYP